MFKFYFMLGGVWVVAQRISTVAVGVCTEEQEQKVRGYKTEIPLAKVNEAIRPAVIKINQGKSAMGKAVEPILPYLEQIPKAMSAAELFLIEKIDGKEAADAARAKQAAEATASSSQSNTLPVPTSQGTTTTPSSNPEDWFPDLIVLDGVNAIAYGVAIIIGLMYLITNHWFFNNIFGICFSLQAIELINVGSYMNGAILLSGLFFYDIFWVFGTEVMVTVAKGVDAPIKLLFPRGESPAMLGLGDIVIPGIFIALMLRFDIALAKPFNHRNEKDAKLGVVNMVINKIGALSSITIATDYFNLVMIGYVLGLLTTVGVMFVFKAAQPALLYLVPACLLFTAGIAAALGKDEFNAVVNYVDDPALNDKKNDAPASPASPMTPAQQPAAPAVAPTVPQ